MNRHDGPQDGSLQDRCLTGGLPEFGSAYGGSFRRIVQTPGGITMFYDVGQGQGWQRNIVMNGSPRLPARYSPVVWRFARPLGGQYARDRRDEFQSEDRVPGRARKPAPLERWTRTGPNTLEYEVPVEDPRVWTRPWTAQQEFTKQGEQENRIYYEPRCVEGNYAFPAMMRAARVEDLAFAQGRGPNPATKDNATDFVGVEQDPFQ